MSPIELDTPPSANAIHTPMTIAGKPRKVRSPEYKAWIRAAGWQVKAAHREPLPPKAPFAILIVANIGRQRDVDNLIKPVLDLLAGVGMTPDDKYCDAAVAVRGGDAPKGSIYVYILEAPEGKMWNAVIALATRASGIKTRLVKNA